MEKAVTDFLHYCRLQRCWSGGWRRSPRWNGKVRGFIQTLLRE